MTAIPDNLLKPLELALGGTQTTVLGILHQPADGFDVVWVLTPGRFIKLEASETVMFTHTIPVSKVVRVSEGFSIPSDGTPPQYEVSFEVDADVLNLESRAMRDVNTGQVFGSSTLLSRSRHVIASWGEDSIQDIREFVNILKAHLDSIF